MPLPTAKRLWLAGVVTAVAVAAFLLPPADTQATRASVTVTNDLCIVAPATPHDLESGLAMLAPKPIPADARCPVCGMYPARYPRWAAQIVFKDGASHYFDSPVDLFSFLQRIDRFNRRYQQADIAARFVTDVETGQWIDVQQAFFVHGSNALGPMRDADLPAFSTRIAAQTYARSRGGKVLQVNQITLELIQSLSRNLHHRH